MGFELLGASEKELSSLPFLFSQWGRRGEGVLSLPTHAQAQEKNGE